MRRLLARLPPAVMDQPKVTDQKVRLLLIEGQGLLRETLAHFLASQPTFEVSKCSVVTEVLEALDGSAPGDGAYAPIDLVLVDLDTATLPVVDLIAAVREAGYKGQFLVLSGRVDAKILASAIKSGVSGIFLKSEDLNRLIHAICAIACGEFWIDPRVVQVFAEQLTDQHPPIAEVRPNKMEERERNVLLGILAGFTNRKIGEGMGLSESAVKNVVQRLFGKAGVKTRGQLVRAALEGPLSVTRGKF